MKNVLYIGNKLKTKTHNTSYIEVLGALLAKEGYKVTYASSYSNKVLRFIDMLFAVVKHKKKSDIVLIDTYSTLNFYYALGVSQLCRVFGLPYVPILHGGNLPNRLKYFPNLSRLIFAYAYTNVAPSLYLKETFENFGYTNIKYIPNTLTIEDYTYQARVFDRPRLLWVRSFANIYNPTLAVSVLKILINSGYDATLSMVGPDSDGSLKEVKQLAKDLNVTVTFTGKLTKTEWLSLSQSHTVFINTTNFDNTPLSVIEAMALGLPVVSTNVGGMAYLIANEKEGLLVEPNSAEAMAYGIERLFNETDLRSQMITNARAKVENFDWLIVKHMWQIVLDGVTLRKEKPFF